MSTRLRPPPPVERLIVLGGAALFVLSIGYVLYCYLIAFGEPLPAASASPAWRPAVSNALAFAAFALHHSVFARTAVRTWVSRQVPPAIERPLYVWTASLLLILVCALWQPVPGTAWTASGAARWALTGVQLFALWLVIRSAAVIDVLELAGLRPASPDATARELSTRGPYGWVRHPLYLGWCLLVFATTPMTMTRLLFAVSSGAYILLAIPLEERTLRSKGEAYRRYAARVRWRLVPGLY